MQCLLLVVVQPSQDSTFTCGAVVPGQWCLVPAHRVTCHAAQPCVSIYSVYLSTKAFTQASLLTRSLNQLYPPEYRESKCRICPISGLLLTPCTPLHTIRRKQGRGSLDQWTVDSVDIWDTVVDRDS